MWASPLTSRVWTNKGGVHLVREEQGIETADGGGAVQGGAAISGSGIDFVDLKRGDVELGSCSPSGSQDREEEENMHTYHS